MVHSIIPEGAMKTIILDYPSVSSGCTDWSSLEAHGPVERYRSTTLPELLQRGRTADVLVSWSVPFRREVLDYLTRPKMICVPEGTHLVEEDIAEQLGVRVVRFPFKPEQPCQWIEEISKRLEVSD
jgi:hypothetical protein